MVAPANGATISRAAVKPLRAEGVPIMANVACFCGCCFSFAGAAGACPECGEPVRLITASLFAGDGGESVCVPHWNGLPPGDLVRADAALRGSRPERLYQPAAR